MFLEENLTPHLNFNKSSTHLSPLFESKVYKSPSNSKILVERYLVLNS